MQQLTLRCGACGRRFPIPVLADAFNRPRLGTAEWACPHCGARREYGTGDYRTGPRRGDPRHRRR